MPNAITSFLQMQQKRGGGREVNQFCSSGIYGAYFNIRGKAEPSLRIVLKELNASLLRSSPFLCLLISTEDLCAMNFQLLISTSWAVNQTWVLYWMASPPLPPFCVVNTCIQKAHYSIHPILLISHCRLTIGMPRIFRVSDLTFLS